MIFISCFLDVSFFAKELDSVEIERLKVFLELLNLVMSDFEPVSIIYIPKSSIFFLILFSGLMTELLTRNLHNNHAASMQIIRADLISNISPEDLPKLKKQDSLH